MAEIGCFISPISQEWPTIMTTATYCMEHLGETVTTNFSKNGATSPHLEQVGYLPKNPFLMFQPLISLR